VVPGSGGEVVAPTPPEISVGDITGVVVEEVTDGLRSGGGG
jgi:hypothetical protein